MCMIRFRDAGLRCVHWLARRRLYRAVVCGWRGYRAWGGGARRKPHHFRRGSFVGKWSRTVDPARSAEHQRCVTRLAPSVPWRGSGSLFRGRSPAVLRAENGFENSDGDFNLGAGGAAYLTPVLVRMTRLTSLDLHSATACIGGARTRVCNRWLCTQIVACSRLEHFALGTVVGTACAGRAKPRGRRLEMRATAWP